METTTTIVKSTKDPVKGKIYGIDQKLLKLSLMKKEMKSSRDLMKLML